MNQDKLVEMYEHLFAQPGWKELVDDLKQKQDSLRNSLLEGSAGFDQIQFCRGLAAGYRYITTLESLVEQAKHQELPEVPSHGAHGDA